LRKEAEPVPPTVLGRFLPAWHGIKAFSGPAAAGGGQAQDRPGGRGWRRRADAGAVLEAVERLAGAPVPAAALETLVLPGRVPGYSPALLDELTSAGEVVWAGAGSVGTGDGWLVLAPAESAPLLLPEPGELTMTPLHGAVLTALAGGGGLFFRMLGDRVATVLDGHPVDDGDLVAAVWDLVWAGLLTNDTLAPLRVVTSGGGTAVRRPTPSRRAPSFGPSEAAGFGTAGRGASVPGVFNPRPAQRRSGGYGGGHGGRSRRPAMPSRTGPPAVTGRWALLPDRITGGNGADGVAATMRAHALALTLLERHGVLTKGAVAAERVPGGFAAVYPVLRAMEETGQCRRGYFVEGLGAAQFALPGAVDRMRALAADLDSGGAGAGGAEQGAGGSDPGWPGAGARAGVTTDASRPDRSRQVVVLAAGDPAQPYGAALPWPSRPEETATSHRPGRKAGAVVVLLGGELVLYVERGGKTLLSWTDDPGLLQPSAQALAAAVRDGALGRITVEKADGGAVHDSPLAAALSTAGFRATPRGLRLRG
jgi:ATP-dependent Lhr-like helicase